MNKAIRDIKRKAFTQVIADNSACFRSCTQAINLCATGHSSDELRAKYALSKKDSIRAVLPKEQADYAVNLEIHVVDYLQDHQHYGALNTFDIVNAVFEIHTDLQAKG